MARRSVQKTPSLTIVLSIGITLLTLYFAQDVLIPLTLAVLLSFLLAPVADLLERARLGRVLSVVLVVATTTVLIGSLGWVVGNQFVYLVGELPKYQEEIVNKIQSVKGTGAGLGSKIEKFGREIEKATVTPATQSTQPTTQEGITSRAVDQLSSDPTETLAREAVGVASTPVQGPPGATKANPIYTVPVDAPVSPIKMLSSSMGFVLGPLGTTGVVLVFTIFMLLEREGLRDRLLRLISRGKYTITTTALSDAGSRISRYLTAQLIVNGTYGFAVAAGLWIIGTVYGKTFPSFVLWALLCAVLRFIPYIGPWVAAVFPIVLSLTVYTGFHAFFATVGMFVAIELISNNLIEPWLYGSSTGMSTTAILVMAVFWTWLWGPVGLLLSTPLTVIFVVIGKHVPQFKFLDVLLGDQPALSPHISYYQRLLADDRDEAKELVKEFIAEKGMDETPDQMLVPALMMARRDRRDGDLSPEKEGLVCDATGSIIHHIMNPEMRPEHAGKPLVLGVPAHHCCDELVLQMLAGITPEVRMELATTRMLPVEIEQRIATDQPAVVFIAVVPPGGMTQARYLCRRLRRRFPNLKIVVGYWGRMRDFDAMLLKVRGAGASYLSTSVQQSRSQIRSLLPAVTPSQPQPDVHPAAEPHLT